MIDFAPINYLVSKFMIPFLVFSYENIVPNYGMAIIFLTIIIKIVFFPLMAKQYASMKAMQKVGPEMQKIREKYKKDPQKMQREMMALYQKHNINPLKGCLPMLVQIPFFLAVYATILSDQFTNLISQPGVNPGFLSFWLSDLSRHDATYILPLLLAIFTYYSQKMIMTDPQQQKFVWLSPILILAFGLKLPSGVLLYWAVSTILSTVQQYFSIKSTAPLQKGQVEVIPAKS